MTEIPEGWRLVPIESIGPMVLAAWDALDGEVTTSTINLIWDAMVKAAPKP